MDSYGVFREGVIVLDDPSALPEGTRVRIIVAPASPPKSFGERYSEYRGAAAGLPSNLADQHKHSRLGTDPS